ncbi:hypothetical protein EI42_06163 [Thermosporothrix hazakensis]|jgi:hypothetical protein|uniref:Uncharacterized protein n=1 Tax=Thermosporothrix hazakensis TaxID=644383 RepID=A0A326TV42_THEHA|nr:hypothetical protein EI42_06163 [Thermosporothrix hazakensis]
MKNNDVLITAVSLVVAALFLLGVAWGIVALWDLGAPWARVVAVAMVLLSLSAPPTGRKK